MDKEKLIAEIIAWNLNLNDYDHETGETELIEWIIQTYKYLSSIAPEALPTLQHANSLAGSEGQRWK